MSHSFDIAFQPPRIDRVVFAVVPFDAFTGRIVDRGVEASVDGLPDKPIRNRSGQLVFVNLPPQAAYSYRVSAANAGYFDPEGQPLSFDPAADDRRRPIALLRRPEGDYGDATTLVRGVVHRAGAPVVGAAIALDPLEAGAPPFETRSGAGGAFALPLRLPTLAPIEAVVPVEVRITVGDGVGNRLFVRDVSGGRAHRFLAPLDLADSQQPVLEEI
jgi:hypothetical protein